MGANAFGDLLIQNCRECYSKRDFAIVLEKKGDCFACPHCKTRYTISGGNLHRV